MAKIGGLKKLMKLKHFSDFTIGELVSSFGMYESAIINLNDIQFVEETDEEATHAKVSPDVQALNKFLFSNDAIMLPCPDCGREQAFTTNSWTNPRKMPTLSVERDSKIGMKRFPISNGDIQEEHHNVFDISKPCFEVNNDILCELNRNDLDRLKVCEEKERFIQDCVFECKNKILEMAGEVRKTFYCGFQQFHSAFVNFRVYDPIEPEYCEEYGKLLEKSDDESMQVVAAYEYLKNCLIIQKVGQYPSLADMQMFDVEKYRKVLDKEGYRDLTRAIGLNADGIGCGAFVYLRRILERLVEEVHSASTVNEEEYKKASFDKRIALLEEAGKPIIPDTLKDVKGKIYGVLSKGVHESGDDECMELFPYMQFCIEQILDERIRQRELNAKIKKLNHKINN